MTSRGVGGGSSASGRDGRQHDQQPTEQGERRHHRYAAGAAQAERGNPGRDRGDGDVEAAGASGRPRRRRLHPQHLGGLLAGRGRVGPFDDNDTFVLTAGDDVFATPKTPEHGRGHLVFGLGGDDQITGSNQADCLVGGDGDDVLGGGGNDELQGENGKDALTGGAGDDVLYGGNGTGSWDPGPDVDRCIDPSADPESFDPAHYGGCESVATADPAAALTVPARCHSRPRRPSRPGGRVDGARGRLRFSPARRTRRTGRRTP